jgi:carbon-monoxide dehydrogenase large subunit
VSGLEYDTGNYEAATDKALAMFGYDELRAEQRLRRESGDPVQLGIGISTFTEMCGLRRRGCSGRWPTGRAAGRAPRSDAADRQGRGGDGRELARAGHETAWSQIVADRLGIPFEDIEVLHGDTQISREADT